MTASRNQRVDVARRAIRGERPYDQRRETLWQYQDRLAAAAVDALTSAAEQHLKETTP